jgi:hypothetical protein
MESQLPCANEAATIKDCITSLPVSSVPLASPFLVELSLTFA